LVQPSEPPNETLARRTRILTAVAALVTAAAAAPTAQAHARLVGTDPGDGAVLAQAPTRVTLVFDDGVDVLRGTTVVANDGKRRVSEQPRANNRTIMIPLRKLSDGDYTVRWRALSDDGHAIEGVFAFGVGAGRTPPSPVLSAGGGPGAAKVISRWFFFAGLLVGAGVALFMPLVWAPARRAAGVDDDGAGPLWGLVFAGCLLAFLGASGLVPHHGAGENRFSIFIDAAGVVAVAGATLAAIAYVERRVAWLAFAAAVLLVPMPSLAGHALDPGEWRPLNAVADTLHVAAAALWVGGLLALAVAVPRLGRTLPPDQRARFTRALVPRLSAAALASVAVIAATGLVRALSELSAVSQLWTTGYGRALIVKSALLLVLVAIGWVNRTRLVPRASADDAPLRRNATAELVILAGIVVGVAFLTDLAPGRQVARAVAKPAAPPRRPVAPPPPGSTVLAAQAGDRALGLALLTDGKLQATVLDPDRRGIDGLDVAFRGGGRTVAATPCGPGCYRSLEGVAGRRVAVLLDGAPTRFTLPVSTQPATALVGRSRRAFLGLRSVVIDERLASSPRNAVRTIWRLAAPNRLTYRSSSGASAVVIGAKRWDRNGTGPWLASPQTPLRVPAPWWGPQPIDAREIGSTTVGGRSAHLVTFFDPGLPAWFEVAVDRRTSLPLTLRMTTGAHFMRHRYSGFDEPQRIRPPR
jgi:copper transport protein